MTENNFHGPFFPKFMVSKNMKIKNVFLSNSDKKKYFLAHVGDPWRAISPSGIEKYLKSVPRCSEPFAVVMDFSKSTGCIS